VIDLTKMVEGRLTLVMERVKDGAFFTCVSTERGRSGPGFEATDAQWDEAR